MNEEALEDTEAAALPGDAAASGITNIAVTAENTSNATANNYFGIEANGETGSITATYDIVLLPKRYQF